MHLHFLNCHGEWAVLAVIFAHMPLVGVWLRSHVRAETPTDDQCP